MALKAFVCRRKVVLLFGTSLVIALICFNVVLFPVCQDGPTRTKAASERMGKHPASSLDSVFPVAGDLTPGVNPTTVHFLWCGSKHFRFENYLSVLSAVRTLRPLAVVFHCSHPPRPDDSGYMTWFDELQRLLPNLVVNRIGAKNACQHGRERKQSVALDLLGPRGGIYLGHNTLVTSPLDLPRDATLAFSLPLVAGLSGVADVEGIVVSLPDLHNPKVKVKESTDSLQRHRHLRCASVKNYNVDPDAYPCVVMADPLHPRDLWQLASPFGAVARAVMYGSSDMVHPRSAASVGEIPRSGHVVLGAEERFTLGHYLSVLSALHIADLRHVHVHAALKPSGHFWETLEKTKNVSYHRLPSPELMLDTAPGQIAGDAEADAARGMLGLTVLLSGGGVLFHPRLLLLQRLPQSLLQSEVVLALDSASDGKWPGVISPAFVLAAPGSRFLKLALAALRDASTSMTQRQQGRLLYRTAEKHPQSVALKDDLVVHCSAVTCRPPRKHNSTHIQGELHHFIWKKDAWGILFHDVFPSDLPTLRNATGLMADIGRYVLGKSGRS